MATRPIFLPLKDAVVGAVDLFIEFDWHPGMAAAQRQKSIRSLHAAAGRAGLAPILEISSKSEIELGKALSAFNLSITTRRTKAIFTVETAFQGSKVFERGGPYRDLIGLDSRAAKKDLRLRESGNVVGFNFFGRAFPATPRTFFYDWIYINALKLNEGLASKIVAFNGFSDIEFNPEKSINCQARSAALYVSLVENGALLDALQSPEQFLRVTKDHYCSRAQEHVIQGSMI